MLWHTSHNSCAPSSASEIASTACSARSLSPIMVCRFAHAKLAAAAIAPRYFCASDEPMGAHASCRSGICSR